MKEKPGVNELRIKIEELGLPAKLVFIDVNGTLIPDSRHGKPDIVGSLFDHMDFKDLVGKIANVNMGIGLCSDSPLAQLVKFAQDWNLHEAPIIAENGNILSYKDKSVVIHKLDRLEDLKRTISDFSIAQGWEQTDDVIAPEFGYSSYPSYLKNQWAFGANRLTSISVFAGEVQIQVFGSLLKDEGGVTVDCSPQHHFLSIHPGNYKENKGALLAALASFGHDVTMIGNSMSDWVDPSTGVKCGFVGGSEIGHDIAAQAAYLAKNSDTKGVMAILYYLFL